MRLICVTLMLAAVSPAADRPPVPRFSYPARRAKLEAALPEVEKVFERYWKQRGTPGLVFGVVIDGELAAVKAFGVRERKTNDPVTPDTVFRIASMTKSFTALAVLKLRDEGRLSLEDPASKYIPELAKLDFPSRDTAPIRVRQLLTHGMGLPEDNPWGDRQLAIPDATLAKWLRAGLPFSTPPDTAFEYSNYGFALAGRVVAKVSGMTYRAYVEKKILAPLGMTASSLEPSAVPEKVRATGYGRQGAGYVEIPSLAHGSFGAMGGMLTSARDLARYVAFHLSAWPPRDGPDAGPVRRSSVREMQRAWRSSGFQVMRPGPEASLRGAASGYGYGLSVTRDCRFEHVVSHGGGLPGFGSFMSWLPEYGVGFLAMTNLTYSGPSAAIDEAYDVLRKAGALRPRELPPSQVLTATRDEIAALWNRWEEQRLNAIAADNLYLDTPAAERHKEIDRLREQVGACRTPGPVKPENLLRGRFRMDCDRGFVDAIFTLAPTMPPKVQFLRFLATRPLEEQAKPAAEGLASLVGEWSQDRFAGLAASALSADATKRQVEALRSGYGACRPGEILGGDGKTNVWMRLDCERGPLDLRFMSNSDGKVRSAFYSKPMDAACIQ